MKAAAVCFLLTLAAVAAQAETIALDGDTILHDGRKVRLFGIDTPEMKAPWGPQARARLDDLIRGKDVECEPRAQDHYGRTVAVCRVGARDLGEALIRAGLATHWRTFTQNSAEAPRYDAAERAARKNKRGLWAKDGF